MIGFVGGRNAADAKRDPSFDDLKVATPGANVREVGGSNPQVPFASHRNVPRAIHDADESFDKTATSVTNGTVIDHPAQEDNRHLPDEAPSHAHLDEVVDGDEGEIESYSTEEDTYERQEVLNRSSPGAEATQTKPDGRNLGRMSGDTYPETTSGRPSTVNADDQNESQTADYQQVRSARPTVLPKHGAGTRLPNAPRVKQPNPNGQTRHQNHHEQRNFMTSAPRAEDLYKDVTLGFAFARKDGQTNRIHAPSAQQSQRPHNQPMPISTPHHGPLALNNPVPVKEPRRQETTHRVKTEPRVDAPAPVHQNARDQRPGIARHDAAREPLQSRPLLSQSQQTQQYRSRGGNSPAVQAVQGVESEMASEVGDPNEMDVHREGDMETQQGTHGAAVLDHYPPQLYDMTFSQLKAAPFDSDPNAAQLDSLAMLRPEDPVNKKMDALFSMDAHVKQEYFISLGIEEWEEAGDWFLESFSKLTAQFKTARQEKRKIAREFESEVEQRHESISKKRKLIVGAMDEMKESGGRVLQGTPKKSTQVTR